MYNQTASIIFIESSLGIAEHNRLRYSREENGVAIFETIGEENVH